MCFNMQSKFKLIVLIQSFKISLFTVIKFSVLVQNKLVTSWIKRYNRDVKLFFYCEKSDGSVVLFCCIFFSFLRYFKTGFPMDFSFGEALPYLDFKAVSWTHTDKQWLGTKTSYTRKKCFQITCELWSSIGNKDL